LKLLTHTIPGLGAVSPWVVLLMLAACGSPTAPDEPVASLTISPAAETLLLGETAQLVASAKDAAGAVLTGRSVTWTTSDATIVTVDATGLVTSLVTSAGAGSATVTATSEGKSSTATLTVTVIAFASVNTDETVPGNPHTCAITTDGSAYCWGAAGLEELGTIAPDTCDVGIIVPCSRSPVAVDGSHTFQSVSPGTVHTCALATDGAAFCWGALVGPSTARRTPQLVPGALIFQSVSAGLGFTCGVTADSAAYCWGSNTFGQLGDGMTQSSTSPVPVSGGVTFVSVSAGGDAACGVAIADTAYCWGANNFGQLGAATTEQCGLSCTTPVVVSGNLSFRSVSAGGFHACGVAIDGTAYCWGRGTEGQLGNGATAAETTPQPVSGGLTFAMLSAGGTHTCGVTSDATVYCWGEGLEGRLGNGSTNQHATPQPVSGGLNFASVSAGSTATCAFSLDDRAYCWGSNDFGQLGDGTTADRMTPVLVLGQPLM